MIHKKKVKMKRVYYAEFESFLRKDATMTEADKVCAGNTMVEARSATIAMARMLDSLVVASAERACCDKSDVFILLHDFRFIEEVPDETNEG